MKPTITLHPLSLTLCDWEGHELRTITVYETGGRVNTSNLPAGWHRLAMRDNGEDSPESIEAGVWVNHIDEYITRDDITALLAAHDGSLAYGGCDMARHATPVTMDRRIYER